MINRVTSTHSSCQLVKIQHLYASFAVKQLLLLKNIICGVTTTRSIQVSRSHRNIATLKSFREELLALLPLEDNTTGDVNFGKLEDFFKKHRSPLDKVNLIVTDGEPAMTGKNRGLVSRIKAVAPKTHFTVLSINAHCA